MNEIMLTIHLYSAAFFNHPATKLALVALFFLTAYAVKCIFAEVENEIKK